MKLQDNLFTIVSEAAQEGLPVFHVRIHPEWPVYAAHFPEHPVTPGVCIVQMVQELLQAALRRDVILRRAKNIKYVRIVSPEEAKDLTVTFSKIEPQADGSFRVQAQVADGDNLCTKLSATFS